MKSYEAIDAELLEKFAKQEDLYVPKDPGRQEYRKVGIKKDKTLYLSIEEALFEIKEAPETALNEYAQSLGYEFFIAYKKIRETGWILMREEKYMYRMFAPDKHFDRKTKESSLFLMMVSCDSPLEKNHFIKVPSKDMVLAICDGDTFLLVSARKCDSPLEVLEEFSPVFR
ncbi:hypothetical protein NEFER03_0225 [Nematocida sp. LUAm3]|nr:hypothetical protein NEFER03_0225 [Nematocida sp. LUAm3]KAI5173678.1 hypothetical protein NEFER02_0194 [Nematocida sp. LUAm2]KAI5176899.1 hypothetical protein NEFER01_0224 [Nematocida sp. LUAm1]